jgi:hypothetical protein
MAAASRFAGFSLTKARALEQGRRDQKKTAATSSEAEDNLQDPKRPDELSAEARRALDDFPYFQRRYFGRIPLPWQEEAALKVVEWLESDREEYAVVNAPPGVGKTLLFTHDIPAWLIVRNRAIRILMGAITGNLAAQYVNRLRRTLESTRPIPGKPAEVLAGTAYDAEANLAVEFGRFKPLDRELWTKNSFVVAQVGDYAIIEKEATCTAYGFDQEFIGNRVDFMVWDDLVNPRKQRTIVAQEQLQEEWDDLVETRLEPRGVLLLPGQRLASGDLYRYNLDKRVPEVIDEVTGDILESSPRYHHLKFQAHSLDRCQPEYHKRGAPAYPVGCLLAPNRLDWPKISYLKSNRSQRFEVVYQQEDVDAETVLVQKDWVWGHGDFPGCVNDHRDRLELPRTPEGAIALSPPLFSAMTVDPSPSKYWGIEWWVYHADSEKRFLMDLVRQKMEAPDFLSYNNGEYSGLVEEWWQTSKHIGVPFTFLIVEVNAAQKFMVQYQFIKDWATKRGVQIVQHTTHRNKTDPELGVWTVRDNWRFGRIDLPGKGTGRFLSLKLIEEVTTYPQAITTDLLMAHWFFEFQLPNLFHPAHEPFRQRRPSWLLKDNYDRGFYQTPTAGRPR